MTTLLNTCLKCKRETSNPKFCSRSCSSSYNNIVAPKRTAVKRHCKCGVPLSGRRTVCDPCRPNFRDWSDVKVGEVQSERKYQKNSRIRTLARKMYLASGRPAVCAVCMYDKHFEVAHIVDINKFTDDDLLSDVNAISNLIALCPNHHWEFDHNKM